MVLDGLHALPARAGWDGWDKFKGIRIVQRPSSSRSFQSVDPSLNTTPHNTAGGVLWVLRAYLPTYKYTLPESTMTTGGLPSKGAPLLQVRAQANRSINL